jgi:hypothetical protein
MDTRFCSLEATRMLARRQRVTLGGLFDRPLALLACAFLCTSAFAKDFRLDRGTASVSLSVSDAAADSIEFASSRVLRIYVRYPSGETAPPEAYKGEDVVNINVAAIPKTSLAEYFVERAASNYSLRAPGRQWLVRTEQNGDRVYAFELRSGTRLYTTVFAGDDGNLVAVQHPLSFEVLAHASRRFSTRLEVEYLFPPRISSHEADRFVMSFLTETLKMKEISK